MLKAIPKVIKGTLIAAGSTFALSACNSDTNETAVIQAETQMAESAIEAVADMATPASDCAQDSGLTYICDVFNAEDLLSLGRSGLILASGMSGEDINGHLYLVDPTDNSVEDLVFDGNFSLDFNADAYPNCPGPLDVENFSAHGLSLNEFADNQFNLYITSHGERESIEIFDVDLSGTEASLSWRGCVVLPDNSSFNSVAILNDGGFITTKFIDETTGFAAILNGEINGGVFEWHPGAEVAFVAGTELSGANGITISEDNRYMYVAAFGERELIKFDRSVSPVGKESVALDITLDNVRWGSEGKLLTAGGNYVSPDDCTGPDCATGWSVVEVDAETLQATRVGGADQNAVMQGVSSALEVDGNIWVGTFNGDRIGYFAK